METRKRQTKLGDKIRTDLSKISVFVANLIESISLPKCTLPKQWCVAHTEGEIQTCVLLGLHQLKDEEGEESSLQIMWSFERDWLGLQRTDVAVHITPSDYQLQNAQKMLSCASWMTGTLGFYPNICLSPRIQSTAVIGNSRMSENVELF